MAEAGTEDRPASYLDKAVARIALTEARRLITQGHSPEEAAACACKGAWAEWQGYVLAKLTRCRPAEDP